MTACEAHEYTTREYAQHDGGGRDLVLVVADGEERAPFPLRGRTIGIGRAPTNEVVLNDRYVSLHHCELKSGHGRCTVRDLGSRNGTLLNGARVHEGLLSPGARISIGQALLLCLRPGPLPGAFEGPGGLIGRSHSMRVISAELARFAPRSAPVLIEGESGTGKELAAKALHELSPRRRGPLVAVNCGALTAELAMSELLGHERGAFTGAAGRHPGAFEQANGGTLFLDEVGELDPRAQAALLRVLETGQVRRVGGGSEVSVSVRVVAATNRRLDKAVAIGAFRLDLYHRLAVLCLRMPPLRDRPTDLPDLVAALLARMESQCRLEEPAIELLKRYRWPGNVRELKNVLERACAVTGGSVIGVSDIRLSAADEPAFVGDGEVLMDLVAHHAGSISAAARAVGIPRTTLRDRLRRAKNGG